jgi:hypothetical protein
MAHNIGVNRRDVHIRISVPKHFSDRVNFFSADEAPSANVPDDVFGAQNVTIHQREIADSGHDEL